MPSYRVLRSFVVPRQPEYGIQSWCPFKTGEVIETLHPTLAASLLKSRLIESLVGEAECVKLKSPAPKSRKAKVKA